MADETRAAGAGSSVDNSGSPSWTTPGNITASDDAYATCERVDAGESDYLVSGSHGFTIPDGSIIDGIEVIFEASKAIDGIPSIEVLESELYLTLDGTTIASLSPPLNLGADNWTTSDVSYTRGSATDKWGGHAGGNWSPANINSSTFGCMMVCNFELGNVARVDYLELKVYYSAFAPALHAGHYAMSSGAPLRLWNHIVEVQGF